MDGEQSFDLELNGLRHRVMKWSGPPAKPWLLLHGWLDQANSFSQLAQELRKIATVYAFDFRGHGHSEWIGAGGYYHFADYVRDVDQLLEQLPELGDAIFLVGHSMGGTVATYCAGTITDRFCGLALLEGSGPKASQPEDTPRRFRKWLADCRKYTRTGRRIGTPEQAMERLKLQYPEFSTQLVQEFCEAALVQDGNAWRWRYDPLHRTRSPLPFTSATYQAFADQVNIPVLQIAGEKSLMTRTLDPSRVRRESAFRGPNERRLIHDAGHMMHLTHPLEVAKILVEWRQTMDATDDG